MFYWLFVLGAGLSVRLYGLTSESLWLDEGYAILMARRSVMETLKALPLDLHPPFYTLSLHTWMKFFGDSEFALRAFSVFFGVLLIPLVYRLTRHLFDTATARYAALFTSFSLFHIYYAQEARPYTFFVLFITLSFYSFVRLLESPDKKYQIAYILSTIGMLYTHSFGVFTVFAQNVIFLLQLIRRRSQGVGFGRWICLQLCLGVLWSPWIFITLKFGSSMKDNWIARPGPKVLFEALRAFAGGTKLLIFSTALILWGFWDTFRKKQHDIVWPLVLWSALVLLAPFVVSLFWVPIFLPRYTIASSLVIFILAGRGMAAVPHVLLRRALTAAFLFLCLTGIYQNEKRIDKEQWREVLGVINTHGKERDLAIIQSRGEDVFRYYLKNKQMEVQNFPIMKDELARVYSWDSVYVTDKNIHELNDISADKDRVWLVQSHVYDKDGMAIQRMKELFGPPTFFHEYQGVVLSLYDRKSKSTA